VPAAQVIDAFLKFFLLLAGASMQAVGLLGLRHVHAGWADESYARMVMGATFASGVCAGWAFCNQHLFGYCV